jgi:MerR family mercuric resistance operon transcriptional regulator
MKSSNSSPLTIGRLARQAGVGVETIRYYLTRGLLPLPPDTDSYRQYPVTYIDRIRFIKRAQELGFSLDEIHELLQLDEHTDRKIIRHLATTKIEQIQQKLHDLLRMQTTLQELVTTCSHTSARQRCPIIASFSDRATQD